MRKKGGERDKNLETNKRTNRWIKYDSVSGKSKWKLGEIVNTTIRGSLEIATFENHHTNQTFKWKNENCSGKWDIWIWKYGKYENIPKTRPIHSQPSYKTYTLTKNNDFGCPKPANATDSTYTSCKLHTNCVFTMFSFLNKTFITENLIKSCKVCSGLCVHL